MDAGVAQDEVGVVRGGGHVRELQWWYGWFGAVGPRDAPVAPRGKSSRQGGVRGDGAPGEGPVDGVTEPPRASARKSGWNQSGSSDSAPATASVMSVCVAAAPPAMPRATDETKPPRAPYQVSERNGVVLGR
ncbi:hypothetical protein ACLB9X_09390 [Streptomyces sp. 5K101]|uniref:hypothetical protein n=1 Tax=Streptomyces sp. 5K101 TaxID=3390037 RepID=UPI003976A1E0